MARPPRLLALALLLAPTLARPQAAPFLPPATILTNYDRVLIGQEEALEAGAFVARVADSTAGWYNPAGLALVRRSIIGASATGYELTIVDLGQSQSGAGKVTLAQLPSFFGAVLGGDVIASDAWRIGFSVTKPTSWSSSVTAGLLQGSDVQYSSRVSISTLVPTLSASWVALPGLRLGAGFGVAITSISQSQSLSMRTLPPLADVSLLRTASGTGVIWGGQGSLGVQWDVTRNLVAGASLRTPTFTVLQSGSLAFQGVETTYGSTGPSTKETYFADPSTTFTYKLPTVVNVGAAWREARFDVEIDVRFHSAIPEYTLVSSSQPITTYTQPAGGGRTVEQSAFPGLTYSAAAVWNVAVGGRYQLDESWSLHGGFYSDLAPAPPGSSLLFRSVNLYGITGGAKLKGEHLSGSLGLGLCWGSSDPLTLGTPGGPVVSTQLSIFSISLLYAIAYRF